MAITREPGRTFPRGFVPLDGASNGTLSLNSPIQAFERANPAGARDYHSRLASHRRIEAQHLADERALLAEAKVEAEQPKNERYWKPSTGPGRGPGRGPALTRVAPRPRKPKPETPREPKPETLRRPRFGSEEYRRQHSEALKRHFEEKRKAGGDKRAPLSADHRRNLSDANRRYFAETRR